MNNNIIDSVNVDGVVYNLSLKKVEITYYELVALRNNSQLVAGQQYRIIDYDCTTTQTNTRGAGHRFDIIVVADDEKTLNENARAIQHEGDTYFSNSNLSAWELKYCLDNDTERFDWADNIDGKGVIYRMKDEHGNDLPYDFKNIMFKGSSIYKYESHWLGFTKLDVTPDYLKVMPDEYYYTFTVNDESGHIFDGTVHPSKVIEIEANGTIVGTLSKDFITCYDNIILPSRRNGAISDSLTTDEPKPEIDIETITGVQFLNKIVFLGSNCHSNRFSENCYDCTFGAGCHSNTFGNGCYNTSFKFDCTENTFANDCHTNTFNWGCHSNIFGNHCFGNTFALDCDDNVFGNCCFENTFGYTCHRNIFGNMCRYNNFEHHCVDNRFGNHCNSNTFGVECRKNDFGNNCGENVFGNYCTGNKFGNECGKFDKEDDTMTGNVFGNECLHNVFENKCHSNTFGNECSANYFQNICRYNNFANKCSYNTLLTICSNITLGYESIYNHFNSRSQYITMGKYSQYNTFGQYCNYINIEDYSRYNVVEPGVRYFDLVTSNPTSTNRIQYYTIEQTLSGDSDTNRRQINVVRNRSYKTTIKNKNSVTEEITK